MMKIFALVALLGAADALKVQNSKVLALRGGSDIDLSTNGAKFLAISTAMATVTGLATVTGQTDLMKSMKARDDQSNAGKWHATN